MVSVGIDVSKGKSMYCIMKEHQKILVSPREIQHISYDINDLIKLISSLGDDVRIIMEATGNYHFPILKLLKEAGFFVSVINPLIMKKYSSLSIRKGKTDKIDAKRIANYGIDNWFNLRNYEFYDNKRNELLVLGRQYAHYMKVKVNSKLALVTLIDQTMPEITKILPSNSENYLKDKITDFIEEYWHYDNIKSMSENEFYESYSLWAKREGYRSTPSKAKTIYMKANENIPNLPSDSPTTRLLVVEACRVLKSINQTLALIISQMRGIANDLPEYDVIRAMPGVGNILAPRLIAEIGDIRRFKNASNLIAYAGLDSPPFQSGQYIGTKRSISKRGSALLRKTGFEVMTCLKISKPTQDNAVYEFILKKLSEGKPNKVAKIAGLNKFLRIYYARVKEVMNR